MEQHLNAKAHGLSSDDGLTKEQFRNLVLASLGSMLEFFEFLVFGFLSVIIGKLFFPADLPDTVKTFQAFALFSLGFLLRPIAGIIIGHFGDLFGRKKLFMLTVFLMAIPTTAIGLLPTYAQIGVAATITLLVLRLIQGVAIAGEYAGATVFVTEHAPVKRIGYAAGWMQGASYIGFFLGAGVAAALANILDQSALESWGWRIPFIAGGAFGLLAIYLRRSLEETPLFEEIKQRQKDAKTFPMGQVFRQHSGTVLYVALLGTYIGAFVVFLYFFMPAHLQTARGFSQTTVFNANAVALLSLSIACPIWGRLADRIGFGVVLGMGGVAVSAVLFLFLQNIETIAENPDRLVYWYLALSVLVAHVAVVPSLSSLAFPPEVRFTGVGLAYNAGAVISGFSPTLAAGIILYFGIGSLPVYALCIGALGIVLGVVGSRIKLHYRRES